MAYIYECYKMDETLKVKESYTNNIVYGIYQLLHLKLYEKANDKLKSYAEVLDIIEGKQKVDNRTAKQIEEDVLNLFRG